MIKKILLFSLFLGCFFTSIRSVSQNILETTVHVIQVEDASSIDVLFQETVEEPETIYPIFKAPVYNSNQQNYSIKEVPSPRGQGIIGYVSDPNDLIDASSENRINKLLFDLEQKSSVEVAVLMLPGIGQEIPKQFAVDLFKLWGIGKADADNGLLILTVMDQRRTEFEVGYGLEPILTDALCYRIGVNEIVPNFKKGNYGKGIINAVVRIQDILDNPAVIQEVYGSSIVHKQDHSYKWYHYLLLVYTIICVFMLFWYEGVLYQTQISKDDFYDKYNRLDELKLGCLIVLLPFPLFFISKKVKKRLQEYRTAPRYSKVNGKLLTLKDEWRENKFLEAAQILEENLKSIRYDVWVTDDESDILILEYEGVNSRKYSDCVKCGYKTFGKKSSKLTKSATYASEGERIDYYECRNCNYQDEKKIILAKKVRSTSSSSSSSSSYSGSSSSSSSSSFGGGSSGGGGAGVSW
ncbi:TPM domain-containing protein [Polaribacter sp. Z014]|uniref:TPM domain-containing protein n=1 Tax=Polaribacter sp. Z014 TaxID=2927126 RepID=UPI002020EF78|nr:TPM domain-containing protein [Polaribacter sp. Z014]MCL7762811.1 TPM domain-containing protein [Polaribacter sp. Z014]